MFGVIEMTRLDTNECDDAPSAMPSLVPSPSPSASMLPSPEPSLSSQPSHDPSGKISLCAISTSSSTGIARVVPNALVTCYDYDSTNADDVMISGHTGADGCVLLQYDAGR